MRNRPSPEKLPQEQHLPSMTVDEFNAGIIAGAVYFTAYQFLGTGRKLRADFPTLDEAKAACALMHAEAEAEFSPARRPLVYATNAAGRTALVCAL